MRLFFAIDLPEELHEPFAAVQQDLADADGLSFTDPEQAHLTMKFLGDTPTADEADDDEPTVHDAKVAGAAAVDAAGLDPFEVEVGGLGAFPSAEYISVVWAGVRDGTADLHDLAAALETATTERGFDVADDEFTPHVTLARMNDARGKDLVQDRLRNTNPTVGRFTAEELRLKRSVLGHDGAEHETVARFPF
ncbi:MULTISPECIES: RNA 2',3'-cyclic phosphodiesterase [Halolamina]|uniref:RNA 2',3'-cyclic phosphodiesterase n=1 Tax=Halolamina pelagica TaxID=699431 RepID=A0A1I5RUZ5_9EURY|nr:MULTISPECIES: RNA 2',3'-cyclic phosphodiesterase [Halolamina]NHX35358.1 RNA 2',3'-cyclic phosphodiesterase [Halolamina sp. R1-12]SFP62324.1 2'-5' RNA ligase [Halolamina pelagica]